MRPSFQLLNYSYLSSIQIQEIGILRKLFCNCNSNKIYFIHVLYLETINPLPRTEKLA